VSWTHHKPIRLHHTDAAGIIFFPRLLELAHEAYEALLDALGFPLAQGLATDGPILPIGRCEADYLRPLKLGMTVAIEITVLREGNRSFTLGYVFRDEEGTEMARAQTVHVGMDRRTGKSVELPDMVRVGLKMVKEGNISAG